jgi:hypothetical protein
MVQTSQIRRYYIGDRVHVTAQQFWSILVGFAKWGARKDRKLLTFGELARGRRYRPSVADHQRILQRERPA